VLAASHRLGGGKLTVQFARPASLPDALALLAERGDEAKALAGGTAGVLMLRQGLIAPKILVDLGRLPDLNHIHLETDGLHLGPLVRLREVERSPEVIRRYPALAQACGAVGNVRVRNQATLGGNLAEADYASDPPAMLLALGASVQATSVTGTRWIPLSEFFLGFYATALEPGELITDILIPGLSGDVPTAYLKYKSRAAHDRPCLGVAVVASFEGEACAELRLAVGAACETPRRLPEVEALAQDHPLSDDLIRQIAEGYAAGVETLDDLRGSAWYRTQMIRVYVRRALEEVRRGRG
jgi:carbon-monoxide dehydrogenase medium subunit